MSHLFSKVIKQAIITFDRSNSSKLKTNFNILKELVDQLTISDIGLNNELVSEETFSQPYKAPCTFVKIFQTNQIAMSVFILKGNYRMPLHDHPIMHGILKVLSGKVIVQSYSKIFENDEMNILYDENELKINVRKENPLLIECNTPSAILTPIDRNFHEITAIENVAAFFDILSPPYDADIPIYGQRSCNFYKKKLIQNSNELTQICVLERIPIPDSYYCDTGYYKKPLFLYEYFDDSSESEVH